MSSAHLRAILERPPIRLGAASTPRRRDPYREPAPLPWLYRLDPIELLGIVAGVVVPLVAVASLVLR